MCISTKRPAGDPPILENGGLLPGSFFLRRGGGGTVRQGIPSFSGLVRKHKLALRNLPDKASLLPNENTDLLTR